MNTYALIAFDCIHEKHIVKGHLGRTEFTRADHGKVCSGLPSHTASLIATKARIQMLRKLLGTTSPPAFTAKTTVAAGHVSDGELGTDAYTYKGVLVAG